MITRTGPTVVGRKQQVFVGIDGADGQPCWTTPEDSVAIVGPPRYGKTSGLIIPTVMWWDGPAVVTSTRADILRATGDHRRWAHRDKRARIFIYDPFGSEPGITSMRWSPLEGCTDTAVVYRRVAEMTATAGAGISDGEHWRSGAASILRGMFYGAALDRLPLREVRQWVATQSVGDAIRILRTAGDEAEIWADDLEGVARLGDRERGSFFSVASRTLEATAEPRVLASTTANDLDIDDFLATKSTLYIVSPSHHQAAVAPLIVGLVASIAQRATEVAAAAGGRLDPRLLLALDEVANIAPLRSLPALISEGAGRGIVTLWAAQTLDQMRARYGNEEAAAILGASSAQVIYGGMSNGQDLRDLSAREGEYRETQTTVYGGGAVPNPMLPTPSGGVGDSRDTQRQHSQSWTYRPVLPPEAIRQTPPGHAWLWYRSDPARRVGTPRADLIPAYAKLRGYTPPSSTASGATP